MSKVVSPEIKKVLKEYESKSPKTYEELLEIFQKEYEAIKARQPKKEEIFYVNRALFQTKRSFRGRVGAATVRVQAISLHATNTFDIAGKRRWNVINTVKEALLKDETDKIEQLLNAGALVMVPIADQQQMIDVELAKEKPDESLVNFYRRQQTDGLVEDRKNKYVIIPLETLEFFDDAGKRKNPNFGKPLRYADRRRIFLIGRTVTAKEVSEPKLMVVEARLDQCYAFEAKPWQVLEGFNLRVRKISDDLILLVTSRNTEWKYEKLQFEKELMSALGVEDLDSDQSRCEILLSAPDEFQLTVNQIYKMYGKAEWSKLMNDYDRFHIVSADLMSKTPFTIGFREEYLAEGTQPDDMSAESNSMNYWIGQDQEEQWLSFGNGSRVIFAGQLDDRQIWDEEAGAISEETAPCLAVTVFVSIPEYREEPE